MTQFGSKEKDFVCFIDLRLTYSCMSIIAIHYSYYPLQFLDFLFNTLPLHHSVYKRHADFFAKYLLFVYVSFVSCHQYYAIVS